MAAEAVVAEAVAAEAAEAQAAEAEAAQLLLSSQRMEARAEATRAISSCLPGSEDGRAVRCLACLG